MTEIDIAQSPAGAPIEYDIKFIDGNLVAHASATQADGAVAEEVKFTISGAKVEAAIVAVANAKLGSFAPIAVGLIKALFSALGIVG